MACQIQDVREDLAHHLIQLNARLTGKEQSDPSLFKTESGREQFYRFIEQLGSDGPHLQCDDIARLAQFIVQRQLFDNGNHRTAVYACYYLYIKELGLKPKIKPYQLYAAVDFEYAKSMYAPGAELARYPLFHQSNAILEAIENRPLWALPDDIDQEEILDNFIDALDDLSDKLISLGETINDMHPIIDHGDTVMMNSYRVYAGARHGFYHSTSAENLEKAEIKNINNMRFGDFIEVMSDPNVNYSMKRAHRLGLFSHCDSKAHPAEEKAASSRDDRTMKY